MSTCFMLTKITSLVYGRKYKGSNKKALFLKPIGFNQQIDQLLFLKCTGIKVLCLSKVLRHTQYSALKLIGNINDNVY